MAIPSRAQDSATVHDAREAYFAGRISADEYLQLVLPATEEEEQPQAEQFRRILDRLRRPGRP